MRITFRMENYVLPIWETQIWFNGDPCVWTEGAFLHYRVSSRKEIRKEGVDKDYIKGMEEDN